VTSVKYRLRKLQTGGINSAEWQHTLTAVLQQVVGRTDFKVNERIFISAYARQRNLKLVDFAIANPQKTLQTIIELLSLETKLTPNNSAELQDYFEMQKLVIGWLCRGYSEKAFNADAIDLSAFPKAQKYVELLGSHISPERMSYFIFTTIFSEVRGALSQFSRTEFTVRAVVQPMGSLSTYPLVFHQPDEQYKNLSSMKRLEGKHQWYIALGKPTHKGQHHDLVVAGSSVVGGKSFTSLKVVNYDSANLLQLRSGKAQIALLDRLLYQSKKWNDLQVVASDYSFIAEKAYSVRWDLKNSVPHLVEMHSKRRVFATIPLNVQPTYEPIEAKELKQNIKDTNKYLGIDVGEYGLGWVVLDFANPQRPERLAQGFIFDQALRRIKDKAQDIKDTQVKGTFSIPNTKLARVREQAITNLRNRVHDLVVKYKAKPIYERSISNFETGSNKTTKIYASVKKTDVFAEDQASKQIQEHVWGKRTVLVGTHISAYATSYTCSLCWKSVYSVRPSGGENVMSYQLVSDRIGLVKTRDGSSVHILLDKVKQSSNSELTAEEMFYACRDFARPPVVIEKGEGSNDEISASLSYAMNQAQNASVEFSNLTDLRQIKKARGNSALFVCPFCLKVSDADIQAAQNIALRGYLRSLQKDNGNSTEDTFDYIAALDEYVADADVSNLSG
jgi:hypothetical protein